MQVHIAMIAAESPVIEGDMIITTSSERTGENFLPSFLLLKKKIFLHAQPSP